MTRWSVGDKLLGEIDGAASYPGGLEIRTVEGSYWRREGGTWESLTGHATSVSSERLFDGDRPAVVTYAPPVPDPHTRAGVYVCQEKCGYRFELNDSGLWQGPWHLDDRTSPRQGKPMMRWHELEDHYGDCARNLVGPVPLAFLKGY